MDYQNILFIQTHSHYDSKKCLKNIKATQTNKTRHINAYAMLKLILI